MNWNTKNGSPSNRDGTKVANHKSWQEETVKFSQILEFLKAKYLLVWQFKNSGSLNIRHLFHRPPLSVKKKWGWTELEYDHTGPAYVKKRKTWRSSSMLQTLYEYKVRTAVARKRDRKPIFCIYTRQIVLWPLEKGYETCLPQTLLQYMAKISCKGQEWWQGSACTLDSTPGDRDKGRNAGTAPPLRIRQAELA